MRDFILMFYACLGKSTMLLHCEPIIFFHNIRYTCWYLLQPQSKTLMNMQGVLVPSASQILLQATWNQVLKVVFSTNSPLGNHSEAYQIAVIWPHIASCLQFGRTLTITPWNKGSSSPASWLFIFSYKKLPRLSATRNGAALPMPWECPPWSHTSTCLQRNVLSLALLFYLVLTLKCSFGTN